MASQPDPMEQWQLWQRFPGTYREPRHAEWAAEIERLRGERLRLTEKLAHALKRAEQAEADREAHSAMRHKTFNQVQAFRAALEWLRGWRMKDHESIDCTIQHALGEAETCTVCHPHGNAALAGDAKPSHPAPTGKEREPPHCPTCDCPSVPASAPHRIPESNDRAHVWTWIRQRKWHMCDVCGVIRRADDRNPPCSGPVKVTTRDAAQPPAAPATEGKP